MNYAVVGTNNMTAAVQFYDALFDGLGVTKFAPSDRMTYWMGADFAFAAASPFDGGSATVGNGTMIGFAVGASEDVERLYQLALKLGGASEGAPGQRGPKFSAYVRDVDGNKLCFSD